VFVLLVIAAACLMPPNAAAQEGREVRDENADAPPTVLVTGANRGLGLEFAKQYASDGWRVIGTAREPETASELAALGVRVVQLDVTDPDSVAALARELEEQPIDLLINNAGIFPRVNRLVESDFESVARTFAVNSIGPMRVTRALLPNLRQGALRTVVSITSGLGSIANNNSGRYYGYRESKAALNMFMRSLSVEFEDEGFTCVALSPGWVRTDMGGPNANLSPAESIAGMRDVIADLEPGDSGSYLNWDGESLPW
jgi:NAD(P)-dependent dehydrogenase (short-subunit alcohol dehydrogenase family)